ncbi:S-layer homology domain-containing protein [Dysosmobacter segnis]|uniref:S-layer homology domain-containing protein n=1 Tax=Dysosmobacter segnis TaxID=2763042 RepID=A0A923MGL6_9FIRM|nr:S-layer homology domain-containing protein [Dysosmobacter segnis]MBC5769089.1 S-layer homology domain-containing protein [Dysosmobacter segnis]
MRRFFRKRLPAFLLTLVMVMTMVPAVSAKSSADLTYEVDKGDSVSFKEREFRDLYRSEYSGDPSYVVFTDYSDLDDYGYLTAVNYYDKTVSLSESDLRNTWFYYDSRDVPKNMDYALDGLTFEANRRADSGTLRLKFEIYDADGKNYVYGTMDIKVGGGSGSSKGDITYTVKAGEEVAFDDEDFVNAYDKAGGSGTLKYVVFEKPSSDYSNAGTVYSRYGKRNATSFTRSELDDYKFYYGDSDYGDYDLDELSFVADKSFSDSIEIAFTAYGGRGSKENDSVSGTLKITSSKSASSSKGDITYTVKAGEEVTFDDDDFEKIYENSSCTGSFKYVEFSRPDSAFNNAGTLYSRYGKRNETAFTRSSLSSNKFYYGDSDYGDYDLDELSFVADRTFSGSVELRFTVYGGTGTRTNQNVTGTLVITTDKTGSSTAKGDVTYTVKAGDEVAFDEDDFKKVYDSSNCTGSFKYVEFSRPDSAFNNAGTLYSRYGKRNETAFTRSSLSGTTFGYDSYEDADYSLDDLSFVADRTFSGSITLSFTLYGGKNSKCDQSTTGTLVITTGTSAVTSRYVGNIRYNTTPNTALQINANDIARLFRKYTSGGSLQYLTLTSVPATGSLYYNYYNASKYGATRTQLTASMAGSMIFSYSPASASEYDLSELTYIPSGSNYCTALTFTGYSSSGTAVSATILISVTASPVSEVYSVTTKGTSVNFPANSVYSAVASATGFGLSSIQLLELPASTAGVLYVGSYAADTTSAYSYGNGTDSMGQLRFIPNSGFTGSVSIPYVALSSSGTALGAGVVSIGVVDSVKKFTDISTSTWCYKYVTELASANVISGYSNGTFQEKNTITYGAALKLIMLAAGYGEQAPTVKGSPFSGYLAKAKAAGLVSGNPKLNGPITRLQIAQIAAKALKLSTTGLPSKKPFTDTNDVYVQALNAAGIIEGYFSNGTSTYKPNNTLTRGQVSAIVWRMKNSVQ